MHMVYIYEIFGQSTFNHRRTRNVAFNVTIARVTRTRIAEDFGKN